MLERNLLEKKYKEDPGISFYRKSKKKTKL